MPKFLNQFQEAIKLIPNVALSQPSSSPSLHIERNANIYSFGERNNHKYLSVNNCDAEERETGGGEKKRSRQEVGAPSPSFPRLEGNLFLPSALRINLTANLCFSAAAIRFSKTFDSIFAFDPRPKANTSRRQLFCFLSPNTFVW